VALREIVKKLPFIPFIYRVLRDIFKRYWLEFRGAENVFTDIYKNNSWGGNDSFSGAGSDVHQTRIITTEIPALLTALHINTILDIPCGDFHWMKNVDLKNVDYTGADIVKELIQKNRTNYARQGVRFQHLNLIKDKLPQVDLIFCRDCLVHLSFADIDIVLNNICNSQSVYFLTTTFTDRKANQDIATGQWRTINLEIAPFALTKPLKIINEGCTEREGEYKDKALGLWKISDIRANLARSTM
jgi:hypothetical protein